MYNLVCIKSVIGFAAVVKGSGSQIRGVSEYEVSVVD